MKRLKGIRKIRQHKTEKKGMNVREERELERSRGMIKGMKKRKKEYKNEECTERLKETTKNGEGKRREREGVMRDL